MQATGSRQGTMHQAADTGVDPIGQLAAIWEYRWSVLGIVIACILLAAIYVLVAEPKYRAVATLEIDPTEANVIQIEEVYESGSTAREYHKTQYEVLKSRQLIKRVIDDLKLADNPYFQKELAEGSGSMLRSLKTVLADVPGLERVFALVGEKPAPETSFNDRLFTLVSENIDIAPVTGTYLVDVRYYAMDPEITALVANGLADAYIRRGRETRVGMTQEASGMLESRLADAEKSLRASERALQDYLEDQKLLNVGGARSLVENELTENIRILRESSQKRESLQNVYRKIQRANGDVKLLQEITDIQQEPLVHETKKAFLEAKENMDELSSRYGPKHPTMIQAKARFQAAESAYHNQLLIRADGIVSEYQSAAETESSLKQEVQQSRGKIQNLDRNEHQMQVLQREVETNRELYNTFLTRYKETEATSDLGLGNVRIIDRASSPREPYSPKVALYLALAIALGLVVGVALALLRKYLDDTISTTDDLEQESGLPILGSLPMVPVSKQHNHNIARFIHDEPKTHFAEGIRTLRTAVMLSDVDKKKKVVMVTSSVPQEGKTAISINLALAMAQMEPTLLIDCDLRSPSVGGMFKLERAKPGLTQALLDASRLKECIYSVKNYKLDVMPAGQLPPNPSELLGSERFRALLQELGGHYSRIIIDTAPCEIVSDSLLMGRIVDGTIFVVRADSTSKRVVRSAVHHLGDANANLIGAMLNQVNPRKAAKYEGGYYYRYGYYGNV